MPSRRAAENARRLPEAAARMRERILKAAHSGDPQQVLALMQAGGSMPVFSHTRKIDPTAVWMQAYPESGGLEALSILITILETGFTHIDAGTPQEIYLWPYFAREPLKSLTAEQKVDLFRIVTGSDYQTMLETGRYAFYRVGIGPDGTWRYFVSGEWEGAIIICRRPPATAIPARHRAPRVGRIERLRKAAPAGHARAPPASSWADVISTTASRRCCRLISTSISRPFSPGML